MSPLRDRGKEANRGQIGINLADRVYRGMYRGNQKHQDDLEAVIDRSKQVGCTKLMVTGSDWHSIKDGADLAKEYRKPHVPTVSPKTLQCS